jgi:flagellar basal body P-ring formation protein FlgA
MNTTHLGSAKLRNALGSKDRLNKRSAHFQFSDRLRSAVVPLAFILLCIFLLSSAITVARADAIDGRALQSRESIRAAAEEYVRSSGVSIPSGGVLHATATDLDARLQLAQCTTALTTFTLNSAPVSTRTTIGVRCTQPEWTVYVPVVVESEIDVLVLRNSMPRDAHLAAGDLETQRRRVPGFGTAYITNVALLRDQHLKRPTTAGSVLAVDMLTRDLVVKRGQHVLLVYENGSLAIQAQGLAMADGGTSDRIRVQNLSSLKVVEGTIESGNLVRVGL